MSDDEDNDEEVKKFTIKFEDEDKESKFVHKEAGRAAATYPNGDSYTGMYQNYSKSGAGSYKFSESGPFKGASYDGFYLNGKKSGKGIMTFPDGSVYKGHWKDDKRHGKGVYTYANKDVYDGEWLADKRHGSGTYAIATTGDKVSGQWQSGQLVSGTWTRRDGSRYTGTFDKGKPAGSGLMHFPSGTAQAGAYQQGGVLWEPDTFAAPAAGTPLPKKQPAPPFVQAQRGIGRCALKFDHFTGLHQLEEVRPGVPNLRRIPKLPVFGVGQPTEDGVASLLKYLANPVKLKPPTEKKAKKSDDDDDEDDDDDDDAGGDDEEDVDDADKFDNTCVISVRQDPMVFLDKTPVAPRDSRYRHVKFNFRVTGTEVRSLAAQLKKRVVDLSVASGGIVPVYKDTVSSPIKTERKDEVESVQVSQVHTMAEVVDRLANPPDDSEAEPVSVELVAIPLLDASSSADAPLIAEDVDSLVATVNEAQGDGKAIVVSCATGRVRTTFGMAAAQLILRVFHNLPPAPEDNKDEDEDKDDDADEEEDDDELTDEQRAERAAAKQKAAEEKQRQLQEALEKEKNRPPDLTKAEYEVVRGVVNALNAEAKDLGKTCKEAVDAVLDGTADVVHLRDEIMACQKSFDGAVSDAEKEHYRSRAVGFVHLYISLIVLHAYLLAKKNSGADEEEEQDDDEEQAGPPKGLTFPKWLEEHKAVTSGLGLRTNPQSAISQFRWQ